MNNTKQRSIRKSTLALFKPPFWFEKTGGYIFDANSQMVGEVRAWGYLQTFPQADAVQDELGGMIAEALTNLWNDQTKRKEPSNE
jgi:hypothetical protein